MPIKVDIKDWKYGDTFCFDITENDKKKYLIIYNITNDDNDEKEVYIKISDILPKIIDTKFLNSCEYLCTAMTWFENRYYPINMNETIDEMIERKNKIEYFPDEYGILHIYIGRLKANKIFNNYVRYIGNFSLDLPKGEFIPWSKDMYPLLLDSDMSIEMFVKNMLKAYHNNNLRESKMFNKDYSKIMRKKAKDAFEYSYIVEEKVKQYIHDNYMQ